MNEGAELKRSITNVRNSIIEVAEKKIGAITNGECFVEFIPETKSADVIVKTNKGNGKFTVDMSFGKKLSKEMTHVRNGLDKVRQLIKTVDPHLYIVEFQLKGRVELYHWSPGSKITFECGGGVDSVGDAINSSIDELKATVAAYLKSQGVTGVKCQFYSDGFKPMLDVLLSNESIITLECNTALMSVNGVETNEGTDLCESLDRVIRAVSLERPKTPVESITFPVAEGSVVLAKDGEDLMYEVE